MKAFYQVFPQKRKRRLPVRLGQLIRITVTPVLQGIGSILSGSMGLIMRWSSPSLRPSKGILILLSH